MAAHHNQPVPNKPMPAKAPVQKNPPKREGAGSNPKESREPGTMAPKQPLGFQGVKGEDEAKPKREEADTGAGEWEGTDGENQPR